MSRESSLCFLSLSLSSLSLSLSLSLFPLSPIFLFKFFKKDSHVGRFEGPVESLDDLLLVRDLIDVFRAAGVMFFWFRSRSRLREEEVFFSFDFLMPSRELLSFSVRLSALSIPMLFFPLLFCSRGRRPRRERMRENRETHYLSTQGWAVTAAIVSLSTTTTTTSNRSSEQRGRERERAATSEAAVALLFGAF